MGFEEVILREKITTGVIQLWFGMALSSQGHHRCPSEL